MDEAKPFQIQRSLLLAAFRRVKTNRGAAGVDEQSIAQFEQRLEDNIYILWNRMSSGTYFPKAVRAVSIPKKDGGERILGIPTVSDRVAQTAVQMLIEPRMEKLFDDDSYGFRPGRSAHQALAVTRKRCWLYDWVLEFDIRKLFDRIDHGLLIKALRHHVSEKWVLLYVERWLQAPLEHTDGSVEQRAVGTPQGGPLSPLLANLFMHYGFDAWMRRTFPDTPFCRYADDGLIHCRTLSDANKVLYALGERMTACGLALHSDKTHIVYCQDGQRQGRYERIQFTFLGYTFQPRCGFARGKRFLSFTPAMSRQAENCIREEIRSWQISSMTHLSLDEISKKIRRVLIGWMNYYCLFNKSFFRRLGSYLNAILIRWGMRKFKRLRRHKGRAMIWLGSVARSNPSLFAHWDAGFVWMVG